MRALGMRDVAICYGVVVTQAIFASGDHLPVNEGLAFGLPGPRGAGLWLSLALSWLLIVSLSVWLLVPGWALALGLGAWIGNVYDQLLYGGGVDYIWFDPLRLVFNVTDVAMVVWVTVVLRLLWRR